MSYFKPGEILDIRDTGELVIVTGASSDGLTFRSRARTCDQFGPERFLPAAGQIVVSGEADD